MKWIGAEETWSAETSAVDYRSKTDEFCFILLLSLHDSANVENDANKNNRRDVSFVWAFLALLRVIQEIVDLLADHQLAQI